jgi:hypothetical protein
LFLEKSKLLKQKANQKSGLGNGFAKRGGGGTSSRALQGATNKLRAPQACLAGGTKVVIGDWLQAGPIAVQKGCLEVPDARFQKNKTQIHSSWTASSRDEVTVFCVASASEDDEPLSFLNFKFLKDC